jgi:galactoside O-acetyltransferase
MRAPIGETRMKNSFRAIGEDVTIWPLAKITSQENISIGNSVIIDDFVFIMGGKNTEIGSFVHIASFSSIAGGGEFIINDFAGFSSGVRVFTGDEDYSKGESLCNPAVDYPFRKPTRSFVRIGKHVIVGANAVIMPGVEIGEGVAIGANSLVKKDCEPWMIYAGTPARIIGKRPKDKILQLEKEYRKICFDENGKYIPRSSRMDKNGVHNLNPKITEKSE